jgi:LysM repeat protein
VILIVSLLAIGIVLGRLSRVAHAAPPAGQPVPVARAVYVVQPGDTLWRIARTIRPEGDVRPVVDHLARSLHGAPLRPGTRIVLPDGMATGG